MKNFYLRILVFLILIFGVVFSISRYKTFTEEKNFQIINERQSVIIQLPSGRYIEMASRNDSVFNEQIYERPFLTNTDVKKNSNLESTLASSNTSIEHVENEQMNRNIQLTQLNREVIQVELTANTAYRYSENLVYKIQIDYSEKVDLHFDKDKAFFEDSGCHIEIITTDEDTKLESFGNNQSIVLIQPYTLQNIFRFNIGIRCSN